MEKNELELLKIIMKKEKVTTEFKKAKDKLPESLFESICSMLNRDGGHVFLGVSDDAEIIGVYKQSVMKMKKEFSDLCNNPDKINPTVHLKIKEINVDDKIILHCYVPESSNVHKSSNRIYDRNEDGDYDITDNPTLVSNLYIRKSSTYIENKIFKYATIENDLRKDLIDRARQMAVNKSANHPWGKFSDIELLRSASLYEKNIETGEEGLNLAAILLFGTDDVISSTISYYKTDAILKVEDIDRYDDRDDIRTNLLDSYERLINFFKKHVNDKFYLEDGQRVSTRDIIARELCANLLIHREYSNPTPAKLIIEKDYIKAENANKAKRIGYIDANNFTPYPKNPKIAKFFKEIGLADELGSGIKKISKYVNIHFGTTPIFKEDDLFFSLIPTIKDKEIDVEKEISKIIKEKAGVSRSQINDIVYPKLNGLTEIQKNEKVRYYLRKLTEKKQIVNVGSNKNPSYKLVDDHTQ